MSHPSTSSRPRARTALVTLTAVTSLALIGAGVATGTRSFRDPGNAASALPLAAAPIGTASVDRDATAEPVVLPVVALELARDAVVPVAPGASGSEPAAPAPAPGPAPSPAPGPTPSPVGGLLDAVVETVEDTTGVDADDDDDAGTPLPLPALPLPTSLPSVPGVIPGA